VEIEFLQLLKSQDSIGELTQTCELKIGAKSTKSRVKIGHKPLRIGHLSCRRRQIHSMVGGVPFDFLCEDGEGVSS
jgi:hypothetical protein